MKKIICFFVFITAIISCQKEVIVEDYLYLGCNSYCFKAGNDTLTVNVSCSGDWNVQNETDWVTVDRFAQDSVKIAVSENGNNDSRTAVLKFVSGDMEYAFEVSQFGKSFKGRFVDLDWLYLMTDPVISKNGRYILGMLEGSKTDYYVPVLINTLTGEMTKYDESNEFTGAVAVSDDGATMIFHKYYAEYKIFKDGIFEPVPISEEYTSPRVGGISSDGSVWVGWAQSRAKKMTVPVKWINGEVVELEIPEETPQGYPIGAPGVLARDCSADGSVVYGSVWDPASYALVYWKDGKMFYPGKDFYDGTSGSIIQKTGEYYGLSYDGKWLAATSGSGCPVLIDTENYEVEYIDGCKDMAGMTFSNLGTMFCASPTMGCSVGYVVDPESGSSVMMDEWFKSKYGLMIGSSRIVESVSSDSNIYFGIKAQFTTLGVQYTPWYYVVDPEKYSE